MKNYSQHTRVLLAISLLITPVAHAIIGPVLTTGSGSTTVTFPQSVQANDFHKPSGTWIAALASGAGDNSIVYATRASSPDTLPTFTGIAGSTILSNNTIGKLAVIQNPANRASFTTAYIVTTSASSAGTICVLTATAQNNNPQLAVLNDATNTTVTGKILSLTGGVSNSIGCAFAAVKTNGATTNFAAGASDALRIAKIDATTLALVTSYTPVAATAAQAVFAAAGNATATGSTPALVYDEILGRLYVGLNQIVSGATNANAATSVAMYSVDSSTPALTNLPMSGTSTTTGGALLATVFTSSQIVGVTAASGSGAQTLSVTKLGIMHTSTTPVPVADITSTPATTGYAYLIVNGGNGATSATGNLVYALPLVVNNGTALNNGKLADVTTQTTYKFDTPASAANKLYTNSSVQAIVGNGTLPMAASSAVYNMWVDGDAVYCSINNQSSVTNCPGVWKSQALFDQYGAIAYWTDWEKVTPSTFPITSDYDTSVGYFAVDSYTGQIWAQAGNTLNRVYLTAWNNSTTATAGLVGFLNSNLSSGCFSVLDMNSSTTGWGANNAIRMALFGGLNTVCFAMTGSAVYRVTGTPPLTFANGALSSLTSTATTVLTTAYLDTLADYSSTSTNIGLVTTGLPGRVNCLGYSGWSANNASNSTPAFFLAGIQPQDDADGGLYAYATSAGRGFNPTTQISDLKNGFFATSNSNSWQELSNVAGTPVKIMSRGGALYVLSQSVSADGARTDYIFRATLTDTVTNLNNSFLAIATSGVAPSGSNSSLATATRFYDFMITSTVGGTTAVPTGCEQLMVLTNDGIYTTTCADGTQKDYGTSTTSLTLQLNAGWVQISGSDTYIEMMTSSPDRQRNPKTFWSSSFVPNATTPYYNSQVMAQMNSNYTGFSGTFGINPSESKAGVWNSDSTTIFAKLPLLRNIYSDGSRRFVVYANDVTQHTLAALPYNVGSDNWNVTDPQAPISSSALSAVTAYYWIAQIGSTGKLMVGTNNGVVSLE